MENNGVRVIARIVSGDCILVHLDSDKNISLPTKTIRGSCIAKVIAQDFVEEFIWSISKVKILNSSVALTMKKAAVLDITIAPIPAVFRRRKEWIWITLKRYKYLLDSEQ